MIYELARYFFAGISIILISYGIWICISLLWNYVKGFKEKDLNPTMKIVAFDLTLPGRPGWNGRFDANGNFYSVSRRLEDKIADKVLSNPMYPYYKNDGTYYLIYVREVNSSEAWEIRDRSLYFKDMEWMVTSIISKGRIEFPYNRCK